MSVTRRPLFRGVGGAMVLANLPACGDNADPVFSHTRRTLPPRFADVVIPKDDTPGGSELGAVAYIERLVTASAAAVVQRRAQARFEVDAGTFDEPKLLDILQAAGARDLERLQPDHDDRRDGAARRRGARETARSCLGHNVRPPHRGASPRTAYGVCMRLMPVLVSVAVLTSCNPKAVDLVTRSSDQKLRDRPARAPQTSPHAPPIVILALDGMSRDLLYDMIRTGELPNIADLLGGDHLEHAYFDHSLLSTLPSTTMAAWVAAMTGRPPADTGVAGNEYFIRERRDFACPAPISFKDADPTLAIYTDHYLDKLTEVPTVYERMREREPHLQIWVAMNHLFRGADRMLLAKRSALIKAFQAFLDDELAKHEDKPTPDLYATLDTAAVDVVISHLAKDPLPDVLTLYLSGTDLYAHVAVEGPDAARRAYMKSVVDPQVGRVVKVLREKGRLEREWVLVIADHGHTQVLHDSQHALGAAGNEAGPPTLLRGAGFRVRPFKHVVDASDPFSAVLAYGGAMAYVYVADRSTCPGPKDVCAWDRPARYEEDVLPAADAFFRANRDGTGYAGMKHTLDMILVRKPRPISDVDLPFQVYLGEGKTMPLDEYLTRHLHPTYVHMVERLHDLAVGVHGERAGDILLLAHFGDVANVEDRYYFAGLYRSWHGSPSRADSEVPLIVANRHHLAPEIGRWVTHTLGSRPFLQKVTDILLGLRQGALGD